MVQQISYFLQQNQWFIFGFGGAAIGFALLMAIFSEEKSGWIRVAFAAFVVLAGCFAFWNGVTAKSYPVSRWGLKHLFATVGAAIAAAIFSNSLIRVLRPAMNRVADSVTLKTGLERNRKTDVRFIGESLPAVTKPFVPTDYWHESGYFLGIGADGKPVRAPAKLPHALILGFSGGGKGVCLSQLASEAMVRDEAVVYIDPKHDEWAPSVLAAIAKRANKDFHFIDLRPGVGAQINMLAGADAEQIAELFSGAFSLGEKGTDADFYRISDRQAAKQAAKIAASENLTAAQLFDRLGANLAKTAPAFSGYLQEMAELESVNAGPDGLDLQKIIENGGAVYIVGSMRNTAVIRMQRMLLVRLIQLAEARDRTHALRPVCIVLDELKYHISRPAIESLGAARDKGVHLVLASQSFGDLKDTPADLDKDAVIQAVIENTPIKILYRLEDPKTAELMAIKSGKIQADDETRRIKRGVGMVEVVDDERTIRQTETYLIDQNQLLNLRKSQAVVFGLDLPKFITTSPILCEKRNLQPNIVEGFTPQDPIEINIS